MRDENQIAAGVLLVAIRTAPRPGETPMQRLNRAWNVEIGARGGARSVEVVPAEQRRLNGIKGALARWGTIRDNRPMPASRKNLDMNQLAKRILDEATGDAPKTEAPPPKSETAVIAGKLGGQRGGSARAASLTPEQRSAIAKKAAEKRWSGKQ